VQPQATIGLDAEHDLTRSVDEPSHEFMEPPDALHALREPTAREAFTGVVGNMDATVDFGPIVAHEDHRIVALLDRGVIRARGHPAAT
jgi:hypothetical protein